MPIQPSGARPHPQSSELVLSKNPAPRRIPSCYAASLQNLPGAVDRLQLTRWTQVQLADGRSGLFGNIDGGRIGLVTSYYQLLETAMRAERVPFVRFARWFLICDPDQAKQFFSKIRPDFDFCLNGKHLAKGGRDIIKKHNSKYFSSSEVEKAFQLSPVKAPVGARPHAKSHLVGQANVLSPAAPPNLSVASPRPSVSPPAAHAPQRRVPESVISAMLCARRDMLVLKRRRRELADLLREEQTRLQNLIHTSPSQSASEAFVDRGDDSSGNKAPQLKRYHTDNAHPI